MTFEDLRPKIKRFKSGRRVELLHHKGNANQTTLRFCLDPVRFAIIVKTKRNADKDREKATLIH
jgi:hypothetical protein